MTLRDYLTRTGLTTTFFGARVGLAHTSVARIADGLMMPKIATARRIIAETGGAVTFDDFGLTTRPLTPDDPASVSHPAASEQKGQIASQKAEVSP